MFFYILYSTHQWLWGVNLPCLGHNAGPKQKTAYKRDSHLLWTCYIIQQCLLWDPLCYFRILEPSISHFPFLFFFSEEKIPFLHFYLIFITTHFVQTFLLTILLELLCIHSILSQCAFSTMEELSLHPLPINSVRRVANAYKVFQFKAA